MTVIFCLISGLFDPIANHCLHTHVSLTQVDAYTFAITTITGAVTTIRFQDGKSCVQKEKVSITD